MKCKLQLYQSLNVRIIHVMCITHEMRVTYEIHTIAVLCEPVSVASLRVTPTCWYRPAVPPPGRGCMWCRPSHCVHRSLPQVRAQSQRRYDEANADVIAVILLANQECVSRVTITFVCAPAYDSVCHFVTRRLLVCHVMYNVHIIYIC